MCRGLYESVSAVVALQDGTLRIGDVENADLLLKELGEYRVKLSKKGHESYEGAGRNDDLVYALALATWAWSYTRKENDVSHTNGSPRPFADALQYHG
jgi:hypothetical protein